MYSTIDELNWYLSSYNYAFTSGYTDLFDLCILLVKKKQCQMHGYVYCFHVFIYILD